MQGEWPVLLRIMGKGEGDATLPQRGRGPDAVRRAAAARTDQRAAGRSRPPERPASASSPRPRSALVAAGSAALSWRSPNFPTSSGKSSRRWRNCCRLRCRTALRPKRPTGSSRTGRLEDRHWFHHASQGTATFPVPYAWFVALEQPGLHLFTRPGLLKDSSYLERFGFHPEPANPSIPTRLRCAASAMRTSDAKTDAGAGRRRGLWPRRLKMSTACRSALRG